MRNVCNIFQVEIVNMARKKRRDSSIDSSSSDTDTDTDTDTTTDSDSDSDSDKAEGNEDAGVDSDVAEVAGEDGDVAEVAGEDGVEHMAQVISDDDMLFGGGGEKKTESLLEKKEEGKGKSKKKKKDRKRREKEKEARKKYLKKKDENRKNKKRKKDTSECELANKRLHDIDFSLDENVGNLDSFEHAVANKMFFVRLINGSQEEVAINIKKAEYKNIFSHVGKVMNIPQVTYIKISYVLKLKGGGEKEVTLVYNKDKKILDESLKMFYSQAVPCSTLLVGMVKPSKTRLTRPTEKIFDKYFSDYSAADKRFYQDMISSTVAKQFILKTKYVRALMGSEKCVNLVSPGHFLCHVPGCNTLVKLKAFNDLTLMILHVKQHALPNSSNNNNNNSNNNNKKNETQPNMSNFIKDKSCRVLIRRHNYIKQKKGNLATRDLSAVIIDMESRKTEKGFPYAIKELMKNKILVEAGQTFKGSTRHTDLVVMEKIAALDPCALDGVAEPVSIHDFFKRK